MVFAAKTTAPQMIALLVAFIFKLVSSNGRCSPFSSSRNRKAAGLPKSFYCTIGTLIGAAVALRSQTAANWLLHNITTINVTSAQCRAKLQAINQTGRRG